MAIQVGNWAAADKWTFGYIRLEKHAIVFTGQVTRGEPSMLWDDRDFHVGVTDRQVLLLFTLTAYVTNAPAAGDTN